MGDYSLDNINAILATRADAHAKSWVEMQATVIERMERDLERTFRGEEKATLVSETRRRPGVTA